MNYKVITHKVSTDRPYDKAEFEAKVLEALRDGYVPVGGVSVTVVAFHTDIWEQPKTLQYTQAVIKQ